MVEKTKVPFREKIGYSLGDGSANLVFQMIALFFYPISKKLNEQVQNELKQRRYKE
jgi:Na+/melibiose symporter-like transporter